MAVALGERPINDAENIENERQKKYLQALNNVSCGFFYFTKPNESQSQDAIAKHFFFYCTHRCNGGIKKGARELKKHPSFPELTLLNN